MNMLRAARLVQTTAQEGAQAIGLENVRVSYGRGGTGVQALDGVTLDIRAGEFVALVGPSGCGKSTILKLAAGLVRATSGQVVTGAGGSRPSAGLAFQNPTLLPWLTIERNIMLPLKIVPPFRSQYRAKKNTEFRDKAQALIAQTGLDGFAQKYPWQLSGGMLQRASLCRAMIHEPALLLLDEPFGALDQFTREELWDIMQAMWMVRRPTVLLVTHDLREAAFLASRVIVMSARPGRILADTEVPLARPRSVDVAYDQQAAAFCHELRRLIVQPRGPGAR